MGGDGSFIRKYRRGRWVVIGQGMGGIGVLVRRTQTEDGKSWGRRLLNTDRLCEGNGTGMGGNKSFVWCGRRKLYRLSGKTL